MKLKFNREHVKFAVDWFVERSAYLLPVIFSILYLVVSWRTYGPVVLSDELGYLTKATTLAGGVVDSSSSWQGGYSFLIAPAFFLFSNTFIAWKALLVINAVMWGFSFHFLYRILEAIFPKTSKHSISVAIIVAGFYPGAVTMSGYAFSTTGFNFIFVFSAFALLKSQLKPGPWLIAHVLLAGYLAWIHPIGFAPVLVSAIILSFKFINKNSLIVFVKYILLLALMSASYIMWIRPWFTQIMTPEGLSVQDHYGSSFSKLNPFYAPYFTTRMYAIPGQLGYMILASVGLVVFAFDELMTRTLLIFRKRQKVLSTVSHALSKYSAFYYLILSVVGVFCITIIPFLLKDKSYLSGHNYWVYGRYTDMVIVPIVAIGILSVWRLRTAMVSAVFLFVTGIVLMLHVDAGNTAIRTFRINSIHGFWPLAFIDGINYFGWFSLGAIVVLILWLTSISKRHHMVLIMVVMIPLYMMATKVQVYRHYSALDGYRRDPSGLYQFVVDNYSNDQCIGVDDVKANNTKNGQGVNTTVEFERVRMHMYYLNKYDPSRMAIDEWLTKCDGPYLTYQHDAIARNQEVKLVGRELSSGLYVAVKADQYSGVTSNIEDKWLANFYISRNTSCLLKGCFTMTAEELIEFTKVGQLKNGMISSNGESGSLFFGPSFPVAKGEYLIILEGENFGDVIGAKLRITSTVNDVTELIDVIDLENMKYKYSLELADDSDAIQIKMKVPKNTNISIDKYSLVLSK